MTAPGKTPNALLHGALFSKEDDVKRANVIVMSEAFWRSRYSGDPSVVGREIRLDGILWTVVGIVRKEFQIFGQTSIWAMRPITNLPPRVRGAYVLQAVGRLKPGVSIAAARADLDAVAAGLAQEFPQTNKGRGVALEPMHATFVGSDLRFTSMLFLGVVGFVLLICCANVANLLLARATVRLRELAVRSALGAGRRRIVRQLLTESLVLSLIGGGLGAALGAAILNAAPSLIPEGLLPATVTLTFDARVVAFCTAAAIFVGLLFGVMPAWKATSFSSAEVIAGIAWTSDRPLDFFETDGISFEVVGDPPKEEKDRPVTGYQSVSASYFPTLDLPIVAGRGFDRRDTREGMPVCIVNEAFARTFHGRSPIGQRVALRPTSTPQQGPVIREIVGVARQVKARPDETSDFVQLYVPMTQDLSDDIFMLVRPKSGQAEALTAGVRAAVSRVDKEQLVSLRSIMTLDDIARVATGRHRFRAVMVMAFATLALVLAMVGVFGMLGYSVQQQVRDFGVRRALGASTNDVLRLVLAGAGRIVVTGTVIGLFLAAVSGRIIERLLFGVKPLDPATFATVTFVLALTAALSIAGPARRATRIDPASALRKS